MVRKELDEEWSFCWLIRETERDCWLPIGGRVGAIIITGCSSRVRKPSLPLRKKKLATRHAWRECEPVFLETFFCSIICVSKHFFARPVRFRSRSGPNARTHAHTYLSFYFLALASLAVRSAGRSYVRPTDRQRKRGRLNDWGVPSSAPPAASFSFYNPVVLRLVECFSRRRCIRGIRFVIFLAGIADNVCPARLCIYGGLSNDTIVGDRRWFVRLVVTGVGGRRAVRRCVGRRRRCSRSRSFVAAAAAAAVGAYVCVAWVFRAGSVKRSALGRGDCDGSSGGGGWRRGEKRLRGRRRIISKGGQGNHVLLGNACLQKT